MAYTPQQWHDDTTDSPYGPISGARLNYIEAGIEAAAAAADAAGTAGGGGGTTPLGTAAPIIDGAAAAGTSGSAAHEDHVHPTDTSRAALVSPTFTGTVTLPSVVAGTPSFTGVVTAPVRDKAGQVFNVKAYGAVGDGTTDDAAAIQAAVDAAGAAGGGIVLFPTGVYKVNTGISVILPSIVFQGSGWDQSTVTVGSVLKAGASMTHLVNVSSVGSTFASQHMSYDGAGNATNCVTIDGLNSQFLQSHARHPATNGVGFNVTSNATSAWFTDCRFNGANQAGCVGWAINGTDSMLHGCKGVNCLDAVTYGSTASGGQQTGCHHTPGSTIGRCAINVAGNAANLILVGNRIDSHQLGSGIQVTPSANIVGLQIVSNTFYPGTALTDNTFAAIGLDTSSAHIYQCVINDNIIRSSASNRYAALLTAQTLAGSAATNPTRISGDGTTTNGNSVYAVAMYGTSSSPLMARGNVLSTDGTTYTAQSNIGALDSSGASLGTAAPVIDGVAAAGSSGSAAHEDHVHPTDTSRAALASPTFSGTPSLPTASVAVTQSAADSSLKLATTAFVTTADNLKANLAGPTFTGTVTLPSTTIATTPSASDNSTKPATTAYVDTADALKANLAGPTFTGSPVLPTGTTGVTQTQGDSSTKLATTAFTAAALPLGPDRVLANAPLYQYANAAPSGQKLLTALKPTFYPVNVSGSSSFSLSSLAAKVTASEASSTFGIAIYSVTYPSSAHVSATLVAQLNAAASGTATVLLTSDVTTGAAGSGAGVATLNFATTRYVVGVMTSSVTTIALLSSLFQVAYAGIGVLSWTAAARSSVTDWPGSFDQTSAVAITGTTPAVLVELVNATGKFYL